MKRVREVACGGVFAVCLASILAVTAPVYGAEVYELSLDDALALAAERAPAVLAAEARATGAQAELVAARVPLRSNPVLDAGAGPHFDGAGEAGAVLELGWSQDFELGGQREGRIDVAQATVEREAAEVELVARELQLEVGRAFLEALGAERRLRTTRHGEALAGEAVATIVRQLDSGDASELEVAVARLGLERARAESALVEADVARATARLRALLGLAPDDELELVGELEDHLGEFDADALRELAQARPERRAFEAELAAADAMLELADTLDAPDLGLRLGYEFEEGAHTVLAGVALTLPVFDYGQGSEAEAVARASTARTELALHQQAVAYELETLLALREELRVALRAYETDGLVLAEQSETMARTAYEAGAIPLPELLTLRRELIAARITYVDLLVATALATFEVRAIAGDLP